MTIYRKSLEPIALVALMLTYGTNRAAEKTLTDSIRYHLDPVNVVATRMSAAQHEIAASVTVIPVQRLVDQAGGTALDVVRNHVPGAFISERAVMGYGTASGAAGGISIRGVGGSPVTSVLVLRDGRPDIMGLMGHPLPDSYPLQGLERIEVIRGPASFLYGSNAMGGVINLVSKRPEQDGLQTTISGSYGTFASTQVMLNHGGKFDRWDYWITAGSSRTDGHRPDSRYNGGHYSIGVHYTFSLRTDAAIHANYADVELLDPGPADFPFTSHWYDIVRYGTDIGLNHRSRLGDSHLQVHGNFGRHRIYDGFRSNDHTIGVLIYHHANPWYGATATVGFDLKKYGGTAVNVKSILDYGDHFVAEYAGYLHLQQLLWRRWLFSGGMRWENLYEQILPKAGVVVTLLPDLTLRASAAKGFRNPSIRELYLFPAPNPQLQPEKMWNYEAGMTCIFHQHLKLDAVLFRAEGEDLIRIAGRWPNLQLANNGKFTHTGYEVILDWQPDERWSSGLSWSKLDVGNETLNTPGKKLAGFLTLSGKRWQFANQWIQIWDLYGADGRKNPLRDYLVWDISIRWIPHRLFTMRLNCKNVLNASYQTMFLYPMPGRALNAEMTITL